VIQARARYAILDLTGVDFVDTTAADSFFKIVRAVELLGARCIISGIKASVAQTMVAHGVDMSRTETMATLEDALQSCLRGLGYRITRDPANGR
jgi:rsbT co-antagonist protein RsbR